MNLPGFVAYFVAGIGVLVIVIFLGFLFAKSNETKKEESLDERTKWTNVVTESRNSGLLIEITKGNNEEGTAVVEKGKWEALPHDSKEALVIAISKSDDIKTLVIKDQAGNSLGVCRNAFMFWENKDQSR